jgi:uncharacterized protein (TIGR02996 family)
MAIRKRTTGDGLLQVILEEPDEDGPRLVYADWLEEQGQLERSEFIRTQCALARTAGDNPRRFGLVQREYELLLQHGEAFLAELSQGRPKHFGLGFRRGFVEEVSTTGTTFLRAAPDLFSRTPLRVATLRKLNAARLAEFPGLSRLTGLRLQFLERADLETLMASPHLTGLSELLVWWPRDCTLARLVQLLRRPAFAKLTNLGVVGLYGRLSALVASPICASLTRLMYGGAFTPEDIAALAGSPNVARLTSLELYAHGVSGAGVLPVLADSSSLSNLTSLTVDAGPLPEGDIDALAATPYLHNLTDLSLGAAGLTSSGWKELLRSPNLPRLTRLYVHFMAYDVPIWLGLKSLCGSVWVQRAEKEGC